MHQMRAGILAGVPVVAGRSIPVPLKVFHWQLRQKGIPAIVRGHSCSRTRFFPYGLSGCPARIPPMLWQDSPSFVSDSAETEVAFTKKTSASSTDFFASVSNCSIHATATHHRIAQEYVRCPVTYRNTLSTFPAISRAHGFIISAERDSMKGSEDLSGERDVPHHFCAFPVFNQVTILSIELEYSPHRGRPVHPVIL